MSRLKEDLRVSNRSRICEIFVLFTVRDMMTHFNHQIWQKLCKSTKNHGKYHRVQSQVQTDDHSSPKFVYNNLYNVAEKLKAYFDVTFVTLNVYNLKLYKLKTTFSDNVQ